MKEFKLNNQLIIPSVGIGTYLLEPAIAKNSVVNALNNGYRLIDTANAYGNERSVGKGIKESKVRREDIFISTKLWVTEYENENAVEDTLERLDVDYIDLLFLHQPVGNWKNGYKLLEQAYETGKIKSIGISNFEGKYLDEVLSEFKVKPQVIQVECNPLYPQTELRKITDKENIKLMSWYPLGGKGFIADILDNKTVVDIARNYKKTPAQIILRWHNQKGFIIIPGSQNPAHIKDNIDLFDFELKATDMAKIDTLNNGTKRYIRSEKDAEMFANFIPNYEPKK